MSAATASRVPAKGTHPAVAIAVASLVNALEWFDLIIFGFLSVVLSKQFFPATDPTTSLLLTFATFGISFVMRPLGGIVFGIYADRAGRTRALTLAALMMMGGTAAIAFLPTYHSIGLWATFGVVVARLVQGFSAGGGFSSSTAFLVEQSPKHRGFFASWQVASQGLTLLLASGAGAALARHFTPAEIEAWAWRIPFLCGLLIGPVSLYMIFRVPEPVEFQNAVIAEAPLRETLRLHKRRLFISIGVTVLATVASYLMLYVPTFAVRELGIAADTAFLASVAAGAIQMVLSPLFGYLGDRHGRSPIMLTAALAMLVLICPLYAWLVSSPTGGSLLAVQCCCGFILTAYFASQPAFMSDLFPVRTRSTGLSLAYNIAVTIFGGFAPFIMTALIAATGSKVAPSYYVAFAAAVSVATLLYARGHADSTADAGIAGNATRAGQGNELLGGDAP